MNLTCQQKIRDPEKFPTLQLFILGIVRLAEPIALTSIYPYAFPLVKRFKVGDENHASFYAGILISAFALAEALTGMFWGGVSDRVGRKPVLLLGCFGTMLSMVMVGLSSNIWMALLARAVGGFLNGNIGVIQTIVGELVTKAEHQPRAYSVMPFVWSIGTIIGPAIGGFFANPCSSFPNRFAPDGIFGKFPYLLPNLLCSGLLLISIVSGHFLLCETHPGMQSPIMLPDSTYLSEETPLIAAADSIDTYVVDARSEIYSTFEGSDDSRSRKSQTKPPIVEIFTKRIIGLIFALGIFTYHSMSYDHLLPIFLEDGRADHIATRAIDPFHTPGGLGISVKEVGIIMSIDGIIALFIQAVIFPLAAHFLGLHKLFIIVSILHPLAYVFMPFLVCLPQDWITTGIYGCLTIRNLLSIVAYPVLLILLKEATPNPSVLGKINGLAASAGAACRTIAPPIAGYLYAIGPRVGFTGIAWYGSALVAIIGGFQCFSIPRSKIELPEIIFDTSRFDEDDITKDPEHTVVEISSIYSV